MHDEILGEDVYGEDVYGEDVLGDEIMGDELLGDELGDDLGDDLVGDDLMGDELVGDDLLGDELGDDVGAFGRARRRRRRAERARRKREAMERRRELARQRRLARMRAEAARSASTPSAADRLIAQRKAMAGKVVQSKGYTKGRVQSVGFTSLQVAPGQTVDIPTRPQTLFRGTRLVIPSSLATGFVIEDIKVGRNSQFVASGGQPAEAFKDTATGDNVSLDTCQPGMDITLKVSNVSGVAADFRATLFGDVVE